MKNDIRVRNRITIKPSFLKVFISKILIWLIPATIVFGGVYYFRRYSFRNWYWDGMKYGYNSYSEQRDSYQELIEHIVDDVYYASEDMKSWFDTAKLTERQKEKLFSNVIMGANLSIISNCYIRNIHLYDLDYYPGFKNSANDYTKVNQNTLIYKISGPDCYHDIPYVYPYIAYSFEDKYVSDQMNEVVEKLSTFDNVTNAAFSVDKVYIKDDFTFVTDKIYVNFWDDYFDGENYKYTMVIKPQIPSDEELRAEGYICIDLADGTDDSDDTPFSKDAMHELELVPIFVDNNRDRKFSLKSFTASREYILNESTLPDGNFFSAYYYEEVHNVNFLKMPARDGKSIWLLEQAEYRELEAYPDSEVLTNFEILLRDGLIIYSVAIVFSIIFAVYSYQKKKAIYDIDTYRRELTNIMAHDIKTPLMVIRGNAENLNDVVNSNGTDKEDKEKKYSDSIIRNVDYMNELVGKTLALSSLESGSGILCKKKIQLKNLLEEIKLGLDEIFTKRNLCLDIVGDDVTVLADEYWIKEAFRNLIDNASKYADVNSVIEIHLEKKRITFSNMASDLSSDEIKRLSDPFAKKDKSRGGRKGSGLGLSIVKNIIELHGWKIKTRLENNRFVIQIICK